METFKTRGIVLRTVKYGDTSIIATIYTELFGIQSYIVKGIRKATKKSAGKANYFQTAAILDLVVYHNHLKQLQFIKEFQWAVLYENIFFNVVRNAVAMYVVELLQHSLKQPEANPDLFYLVETTLEQVDKGSDRLISNLPLYFVLHLSSKLGFQLQGSYNTQTPFIDLMEGKFVQNIPNHPHYIAGDTAEYIAQIASIQFYGDLETIQLNRQIRQRMLQSLQEYILLHVADSGEMRSTGILQEVLK